MDHNSFDNQGNLLDADFHNLDSYINDIDQMQMWTMNQGLSQTHLSMGGHDMLHQNAHQAMQYPLPTRGQTNMPYENGTGSVMANDTNQGALPMHEAFSYDVNSETYPHSQNTASFPPGQLPLPSPDTYPNQRQGSYQQTGGASFGAGQLQPQPSQGVPIVPHNEPPQQAPTGPMSSNVKIPPRPKPGRKPIPQEDAQDRRRTQNRKAQRNFRDKRQQQLHDTQEDLKDEKLRHNATDARLRRLQSQSQQREIQLQQRIASLESQLQDLKLHTASGSPTSPLRQAAQSGLTIPAQQPGMGATAAGYHNPRTVTPPDESQLERDFTTFGRRTQPGGATMGPTLPNNNSLDSSEDFDMNIQQAEENCGFCSDGFTCLCRQLQEDNAQATQPSTSSQAGLCGPCQQDPARAAACRQIATGAAPQIAQANGSMMSCSKFMDQATPQHPGAIPDLFRDRLRAHARPNGGFEVEEHEAAQALQTLSRRDTITN